jgi:hypothetical protein
MSVGIMNDAGEIQVPPIGNRLFRGLQPPPDPRLIFPFRKKSEKNGGKAHFFVARDI